METAEIYTTLDLYQAAFLMLSGTAPTLNASQSGRVFFQFPVTPELYQTLANYSNNAPVLCLDFLTAVKQLRARMLALRGNR